MARIRRITPTARQRTAQCHGTYYQDQDPIQINQRQLMPLWYVPYHSDKPPADKGVEFVIANIEITLSGAEVHRLLAMFINPPKPKQEEKK